MLFLGHIGMTAFISSILFLPILGGLIGVLLPDIIDKGIFMLGYAPCGRFIAHSIFFPPLVGILSYVVTRNKKFAIAVALGSTLHLVQDLNGDVPFLAPFKDYEFYGNCAIKVSLTRFVIITESIGVLLLAFMVIFGKQFLELRKFIWKRINKLMRWSYGR